MQSDMREAITNPCCPGEPIEAEVFATVEVIIFTDGWLETAGHLSIGDTQREALYGSCGAFLDLRSNPDGTHYLAK